ncbi:MAG: hypothetical protein R3F17_15250 [Planctomycetota bacterium]
MYLFEGGADSPPAFWQEDLQREEQAVLVPTSEARTSPAPSMTAKAHASWWMPRAGRIFVPNLMAALQNAHRRGGRTAHANQGRAPVRDEQGEVTAWRWWRNHALTARVLAPGAWAQPFARELGLDFPRARPAAICSTHCLRTRGNKPTRSCGMTAPGSISSAPPTAVLLSLCDTATTPTPTG